jgi:hypothetical protein
MASLAEKAGKKGDSLNGFYTQEIFEEMLLRKLFTSEDGLSFRDIVNEAVDRKLCWRAGSRLFLSA